MPTIRQAKVGEMIKRELAEFIQKEIRDPRLTLVTVTDVDVARDFSMAKVYISVIGTPQEKADALKALQGAAGFLRGHLGRVMDMRTIPVLAFRYDAAIERGVRMFELLRTEGEAIAENAELAAEYETDETDEGEEIAEETVEKTVQTAGEGA
jgi:ribosome-binding factor A